MSINRRYQNFRVIDVPGDSFSERGASHGAQLKTEIASLWTQWTSASAAAGRRPIADVQAAALAYADQVWPVLCQHAPDSAAEIQSLAEAAGQPLNVIVALNCNDEIGLTAPLEDGKENVVKGHCSGGAIRLAAEDGAVCGQNWDCPLYYLPLLLRVTGASGLTELHLTFPGIISGPFLTSKGLAMTWFTVIPRSQRMAGLPNPVLMHEAAARCSSAQEVVDFLEDAPRCFGSCFITTDATGTMAQFESDATTADIIIISSNSCKQSFAHANNYLTLALAQIDMLGHVPWTTRRTARAEQIMESVDFGRCTREEALSLLQKLLADGEGMDEGVSICEHSAKTGGEWETLAGIVFDSKSRCARVKPGRPDDMMHPWEEITLASTC